MGGITFAVIEATVDFKPVFESISTICGKRPFDGSNTGLCGADSQTSQIIRYNFRIAQ
jgi:hypothetical protein